MTNFAFDENWVSDLHKDAYGFRPDQVWREMWSSLDDEGKQNEWVRLINVMEVTSELEEIQQVANVTLFEQLVSNTIESGAADKATAHRWIMETSTCNGDWEFLSWKHGLPYNYFE